MFPNECPLVTAFSSSQIDREKLQNLDNNNFENTALNQEIYITKTNVLFHYPSLGIYLNYSLSTYYCVKLTKFIQTRKIIGLEKT